MKLLLVLVLLLVSCALFLPDVRYVEGAWDRDVFIKYLKEINAPYEVIPRDHNLYEIHYRGKIEK